MSPGTRDPGTVRIHASAPGKVVLWGEYAVLAGAPAMVMAVDRFAHCTIDVPGGPDDCADPRPGGWTFSSRGFTAGPEHFPRAALLGPMPPAAGSPGYVAWHVLQATGGVRLPAFGRVEIDTRGFYQGDQKLGIGSSAAVCVALYGAFCELLGIERDFATVASMHHRLQGNRGSGVDVAAAFHGGLLRFERTGAGPATVRAETLPSDLARAFLWVGHASATTEHLGRFAEWRARGREDELVALVAASRQLFVPGDRLAGLARYVECLKALDRAAALGIYGPAHQALDRLAAQARVVYKPCGAGGGDLGAVFSSDPLALAAFVASARDRGFAPISLETASHGIQIGA